MPSSGHVGDSDHRLRMPSSASSCRSSETPKTMSGNALYPGPPCDRPAHEARTRESALSPRLDLRQLYQPGWSNLHCTCQPEEYTHRRLTRSAFDHAHEGPVDFGSMGQLFLCQARFFPNCTQHLPERRAWIQRPLPFIWKKSCRYGIISSSDYSRHFQPDSSGFPASSHGRPVVRRHPCKYQ